MTQSDRRDVPKTNFRLFIKLLRSGWNTEILVRSPYTKQTKFAVKKRIENLNLEVLMWSGYLPTRTVISQLKYRRKRNVVPVAPWIDFLFMPPNSLLVTYIMFMVSRFFMKDFSTHSMLVVPINKCRISCSSWLNPEGVCFDNEPLTVGKRLQLSRGV